MADKKKYLNLEGLTEVAEKVNQRLRIVTTMPANPEVNDIVKYNGATTANFEQGSTYLYTKVGEYFGWNDLSDVFYTKSETPAIGDTVYSDTSGTDSGYTVVLFDALNNQIQVDVSLYDRDSTKDTNINDWVSKNDGTSVVLNEEDKTGGLARFYAPIGAGTSGQMLISKGEGAAPEWASATPNGYAPSFLDSSLVFTYGVLPEVDGNSLIFDLDGN